MCIRDSSRLISKAYASWANLSENELAMRMGEDLAYRGARGKDPQTDWKPILQKTLSNAGAASPESRRMVSELIDAINQSEWVPQKLDHF
eukprot:652363-Pyramimonas_sp.AAC.1